MPLHKIELERPSILEKHAPPANSGQRIMPRMLKTLDIRMEKQDFMKSFCAKTRGRRAPAAAKKRPAFF